MRNSVWGLGLLLLTACSGQGAGAPFSSGMSGKITAVGYAPISLQQPTDPELKLLHAMRASKMDAYRELTEQLAGVMTSSSSQMNSQILEDGTVRNSSRGVVRGAEVINSYPDGDMYITELSLDLKLYEKLRQGR
ncbi:MAG: hypothetical protein GX324_06720 [Aeromonadales bacterium]|nr:hypothetical protein [Aeromonadales bacterium]